MAEFPQWALGFKRKGTILKKVGKQYFLYSNRSYRVKGRKNPKTEQVYIGLVTEKGIVEKFDINTTESGIRVMEYGFSKVVMSLAPQQFMKDLGTEERAGKVLKCIICSISPESYLAKECKDVCDAEIKANISNQAKKYEMMTGLSLADIYSNLHTIYLLDIGGRQVVSGVSEEQKQYMASLGVVI